MSDTDKPDKPDKPRSDIRGPKVLQGIRFRSVLVDFVWLNKVDC